MRPEAQGEAADPRLHRRHAAKLEVLLPSCLLSSSSRQPSSPPSSFSCSSRALGGWGGWPPPLTSLLPSVVSPLSLLQGLELCRVVAVHVENLLSAREKQLTLPPSEITLL